MSKPKKKATKADTAPTAEPVTPSAADDIAAAHTALDEANVSANVSLCERIDELTRSRDELEEEGDDLRRELDDIEATPEMLTEDARHALKRWREHHPAYGGAELLAALREEP